MRFALAALLALAAFDGGASDMAERAAKRCAIDTAGSTTELAAAAKGTLVITIRPDAGVHVQAQAPVRATLAASPGLALAKERLGREDLADPNAASPRFEVAFTAAAPGRQEARARLEFYLCSDAWCVKQEREVALSILVGAERGAGEPASARP